MSIIPKDKDPILDQKFFDLLFPIIFPLESKNPEIFKFAKQRLAIEMVLLSTGSLLEAAISVAKGITRHATMGRDFVDGSDAKCSSVRWYSNFTQYGAPITNIHNKRGLLRCVVYERLQDKFYFFLIPHRAYANIPKTSNIEIPFHHNGDPRRNGERIRNVDWWTFEVPDFNGILGDTAADFEFVKEKEARLFKEAMQRIREQKKSLAASQAEHSL
jgi:hypothetical protein